MQVILKNEYKTLGKKGDIVSVKSGYARNYLIPKGLAIIANASNKKVALENSRQAVHKASKLKADAQETLALLTKAKIVIRAKVGEAGKIFGSITPLQISNSLKEQGIRIDYRKINIDLPIKQIGKYQALVTLHKTITYKLVFEIVST